MKKPNRLPEHIWQLAVEQPNRQFSAGGGKQIRAAMLSLSYQMAGGVGEPPKLLTQAIERLHAGSLIIDDIEDGSHSRRDRPCLHLELGVPMAINTGTKMYFESLAMLLKFASRHPSGSSVLAKTIKTIERCHDGQAIDLSARADELERDAMSPTAMTISRLKTGALTGLATWIGATVGGAERTKLRALTRFGKNIGICLQMHNDIDEIKRYVNGGQRCDDLRNARVTWPWAWAGRLLSANRFADLQRRYGRTVRNHHGMRGIAAELLEIVCQHGQTTISRRLDQQSRLLGEHIEVLELIDKMTVALSPLKRTIVTRVSNANVS